MRQISPLFSPPRYASSNELTPRRRQTSSTIVGGDIAVAETVDAEPVVYASNVIKERPKWLYWCLGAFVGSIIIALALGLAISNAIKDERSQDLRDPRCVPDVSEQDVFDMCHCQKNASSLILHGEEETLYELLNLLFLSQGLLDQTYNRDSCALEHQALLSIANYKRFGLDLDDSIKMLTGDAADHPNLALVQRYGMDVVSQQFVIKMLYLSTGGQNWDRQKDWMKTALVCEWEGITCSLMERIQIVRLPANNLSGTLPRQIGYLPYLRTLDLSFNPGLTGTIPSTLDKMESLHEFDMRSCNLTGTLPSELSAIEALDRVVLSNNTITGTIPPEYGDLGRVSEIDLDDNRLTGSIPSAMFGMTSLEIISLKNNLLTGTIPAELGRLKLLEQLDMSYNLLTGSIPDVLGNFSRLVLFVLTSNRLSGEFSSETYCQANVDRTNLNIMITDCTINLTCSCCAATALCADNLPSLAVGIV